MRSASLSDRSHGQRPPRHTNDGAVALPLTGGTVPVMGHVAVKMADGGVVARGGRVRCVRVLVGGRVAVHLVVVRRVQVVTGGRDRGLRVRGGVTHAVVRAS